MADPATNALQTGYSGPGRTASRVGAGQRTGRERFKAGRRPLSGEASHGGGRPVLPARVGPNHLAQARDHLRLLPGAQRPRAYGSEPGARIDYRDFDRGGVDSGSLALNWRITFNIKGQRI